MDTLFESKLVESDAPFSGTYPLQEIVNGQYRGRVFVRIGWDGGQNFFAGCLVKTGANSSSKI